MSRREFTKKTKRAALQRSGMLCEAVGEWYGLLPGQRCNLPLSAGVQFDHINLDANSKDSSIENCAAVCIKCHAFKTANHDIPVAAKTLRQQDAARGIAAAKQKIPSRPKRAKPAPKHMPLAAKLLYRRGELAQPSTSQDRD
jgi:hypothetical protein